LKYWEEGLKLILVKNKEYFEADFPYLDAVSISFLVDKNSEFLLFLQGKLDYISGFTPALIDEILDENGNLETKYQEKFNMYKIPYLNTEYIGILADTNLAIMRNSPLKNLAFRKALNYAIDKKKMLQYLQNNVGEAANYGMIPSGLWNSSYKRAIGYSFQEDKARSLFKQASEELGMNEFPPIKISATNKSINICKYIQHEWSRFGIQTEIELNQWAALKEMVANSRVNMFRASWIADYPDPENYLLLFNSENFSPRGPNYTHFQSNIYDSLMKNLNFAKTLDEKFDSYRIMDSLILTNASVIPLYYDEVLRFVQPEIQGFEPNSMNLMVLKSVKKIK
ncbi:MAG: ABC transporter substrate-binding protein, partial [Bacteroidales bacterium]|nr:ABC transporter substrate-binding protein [Bacteroidales bacterium]